MRFDSDHAPFPETRYSAIRSAASADTGERTIAFDRLATVYWKPVYAYLRLKWRKSREDAQDIAQHFFATAFDKGIFAQYNSTARFRTFIRTCLDNFVLNEAKSATRLKRGGGVQFIPLEWEDEEGHLRALDVADEARIEEEFERAWLRGLFAVALTELREECERTGKQAQFTTFERYDISRDAVNPVSYDGIASELSVPVTTVTNYLAAMRRRFRTLVLARLKELTGSDEEFIEEARVLLGVKIERQA